MTEPGAGLERVVNVVGERIGPIDNGGDSALSVVGVGLEAGLLGHEDDVGVLGDPQREREAGDPGTDDEDVRLDGRHPWRSMPKSKRSTAALPLSHSTRCSGTYSWDADLRTAPSLTASFKVATSGPRPAHCEIRAISLPV